MVSRIQLMAFCFRAGYLQATIATRSPTIPTSILNDFHLAGIDLSLPGALTLLAPNNAAWEALGVTRLTQLQRQQTVPELINILAFMGFPFSRKRAWRQRQNPTFRAEHWCCRCHSNGPIIFNGWIMQCHRPVLVVGNIPNWLVKLSFTQINAIIGSWDGNRSGTVVT
jgi:hypothetical protein